MISIARRSALLFIVLGLFTFSIFLRPFPSQAQDPSLEATEEQLYIAINQMLIDNGLRPLARNAILDSVAQTIASEVSANGEFNSLPDRLADQQGYLRWSDRTQRVAGDPYVYIGVDPLDVVVTNDAFFGSRMQETVSSGNYREIGIAAGTRIAAAGGTEQSVFVVIFGAQPNTIPLIIGNGAPTVYSREVSLYVHNEFSWQRETDGDTVVRIDTVRFANSEEELDSASSYSWDDLNSGVPWQLTDGFGAKTVWVELIEEDTGIILRSSTTVEYADLATAPAGTTFPDARPVTLIMSFGGDTFTLQVQTERAQVDLSELYFLWQDDINDFGLEDSTDLSDNDELDLAEFSSSACIQIRVSSQPSPISVSNCSQIYLEASFFSEMTAVFWNPEFETFSVFHGPRELGSCDSATGRCELRVW